MPPVKFTTFYFPDEQQEEFSAFTFEFQHSITMNAQYFEINKAGWDARTAVHQASEFYDLPGFKSGRSSLKQIELEALSELVPAKKLLHLQCHFGMDTLSWARMGASVTGCDFSSQSITFARQLSDELGIQANFVECNVFDLPKMLNDRFDIIFTSYGVIWWLPDLKEWANVIAHFLKPGGIFYMVEHHPALMMYDFERCKLGYPYFNTGEPVEEIIDGTYADPESPLKIREFTWSHSLEEVLQSLLEAGLVLERFQEFPFSPYNCFSGMRRVGDDQYVYGDVIYPLPHVFSVFMRKPGAMSEPEMR